MIRRSLPILLLLSSASLSAQSSTGQVDSVFQEFASRLSPGCAVGVRQGERVAARAAYGMADLERAVPLTPQSVFYMASVSKQFAALATLLLERDGAVSLDDRATKYVRELPAYASDITIRQLLQHTSGLRDYLTLSFLAGRSQDQTINEREFLQMMRRQRSLNFAPDTEHLYSNSGYVLLSIIVHRVSGKPLDVFARERIFTPLGMLQTRFQHDHSNPIPGRAIGHARQGESWHVANSMLDVVGDGGMYSSVDDMLQWAAAFDHPTFKPLLARMAEVGVLANGNRIANGYGMGLQRGTLRTVPTISHGGALAGYRTNFLHFPTTGTSVVVLCNASSANVARLSERVAEQYTTLAPSAAAGAGQRSAMAPSPSRPVPDDLARALAGTFYSDELDATYRITQSSAGLQLEAGYADATPLSLLAADRVGTGVQGVELSVRRGASGQVLGFALNAGRVRDLAFVRRD